MTEIHFKDSIVIAQPVSDTLKTDASTILNRDKKTSLKVQIDATHSGALINRRVYPGRFVKNGYKSFFSKDNGGTAEYDKPILKHHDMHEDPIGRIVSAMYTQLAFGDDFDNDFLHPDKKGGKGSGVVTIDAIISDSESIEKILDSRYLSVSAGHSSPYLLCSTCGDSLYTCEHYPGEKYNVEGEADAEGEECYGITGPMTYHETSFVNLPASPPAKLINFAWEDSKEEWGKKGYIASQIQGRKDTVRNFCLCDEDGELSLLNGEHKESKKKTVVAVSPAIADKLKHVMSSDESKVADESHDDRKPDDGDSLEVLNVERNLDKATDNSGIKSEEDNQMEKELEKMQTELDALKDELATAKTKVTDLENEVQAKDSQIERLTADAQASREETSKSLAVALSTLRTRFGKALPKGEDGEELSVEDYTEKLSARSVESLKDSLSDLMFEIDQLPADQKVTKSAQDIVSNDKVTDPNLKDKGMSPKKKASDTAPKSAIDVLSNGLLGNKK